jgi:cyclophilin family peptidyl-prolyl cis-trans isomerase
VSQHEENLIQHLKRDEQMHELAMSEEFDAEYSELQMENIKLKNELRESKALLKHQNYDNKPPGDLKKKIDELTSYKKKMQENIQLLSKTILLEKFGPGPHKVEIKVQFDPSSEIAKPTESGKDTGNIVIELAPVDDLPHVVYWFLEQVSRKLYDGCSFHRSAEHVIQGGPTPNFLSPANPGLQKRFKDSGFDSVLFQEYSAKHPHVKYTLGYAGRPGGPDFYISTMNNTKDHGPGGQTDYEDPTEADPCFAKVIEGFDVVDRMHKSPVNPGWYHGMAQNIAILSMRIL